MIHISDIAKRLESFLETKGIEKFKILLRINFNVDVYAVSSEPQNEQLYREEFINSLLNAGLDGDGRNNDEDSFYVSQKDYLRLSFHFVNESDANNDPFYNNLFSETEHIDWGPRYRFDSLLRKKISGIQKRSSKQAPVVTFYSYKGGMGRTTTMIAYALSLASNKDESKRKRVVVVDCDLEAPGYLNFFDLSKHKGLASGKKNGLVEFISDALLTSNPDSLDINDYIINVGLDNESNFAYNNLDQVWLVPAGNLNEGYDDLEAGSDRNDYLEGLAKINLSNVRTVVHYFDILFSKINETIRPDIILIDSRTGFNDIFGTAALYLSSRVVGFFGFSRQTQPGLIHLLKEYFKEGNDFVLDLVFSILPQNCTDEWLSQQRDKVYEFINYLGGTSKTYPTFHYLHRNPLLERIGTGDEAAEKAFVELIQKQQFVDYRSLFDQINSQFFKEDTVMFSSDMPAIQLRNVVLKHLKGALSNVSNFAEDTEIVEEQFFYRKCMKELFDSKKYIIQGYKGTGKTYIYKALGDKNISKHIQEWADSTPKSIHESVFVNVLPPNEAELVFDSIRYGGIEEPEYYFNIFWQVYTWNALLLRPEFEDVKNRSQLKDEILPMEGTGYAKEALIRIDRLINDGVKTIVVIEKDIIQLNEYLKQHNQKLFVLYDRLDTCINPLRWNKAVSPLINYWRNNCESFSNIIPKIFVRTDLFKQIEGTNTARLENNIIRIEWSIGEVFGYFFKLLFSDPAASDAFWAISKKAGMSPDTVKNTKISFARFPKNQFKSLTRAEMMPFVQIFFSRIVKVGDVTLGTPWDYFSNELANADHSAISLRPFINTLDKNAVDKALSKTERYVQSIIPPEIYASKSVRAETTNKYFDDLTQDAFSNDLKVFRDVIRSAGGEVYRFKSLTEGQFDSLISTTFSRIVESAVVKSLDDLKRLVFANGIMAEILTTKGRFFRFAPIYWYSWGLANSILEAEEKKKTKALVSKGFKAGDVCEGIVEEVKRPYGKPLKRIIVEDRYVAIPAEEQEDFMAGDEVEFTLACEPNRNDPSKLFWKAVNIHMN